MKDPEIDRHRYNFSDQGQKLESEITDEELFKISYEKTSEGSDVFNLSHSRTSKNKQRQPTYSKDDISDILNDEVSTLKDFSNLGSSKTGSALIASRFRAFSRNTDKIESDGNSSNRPCKSSNEIPVSLQNGLELVENPFSGCGKTYD